MIDLCFFVFFTFFSGQAMKKNSPLPLWEDRIKLMLKLACREVTYFFGFGGGGGGEEGLIWRGFLFKGCTYFVSLISASKLHFLNFQPVNTCTVTVNWNIHASVRKNSGWVVAVKVLFPLRSSKFYNWIPSVLLLHCIFSDFSYFIMDWVSWKKGRGI